MSCRIRSGAVALTAAAVACLGSTGVASAKAHHSYSAWDEEWLMTSIQGDRFEIQGGQLAASKATNPAVKALGARLVKDHTKSLGEAVKAAKKLGISVPKSPTPSEQWELKVVASFSGSDFDRWYSDLEVQDHKQDIEESNAEVKMGSNRQVRKLAKTDLPMLKTHLSLSKAALQAAGGTP
jgi:putative membrane protein